MANFKRIIIWMSLAIIIALAIFSIYGAFLGAEKASIFFNSPPLAAYWFIFLIFLLLGFLAYPRLIKKPALLMMHLGCVLIFIGGLWGSGTGHELQKKYLGKDKILKTVMVIYEGQTENRLLSKEDYETVAKTLDFAIRLDDFHMDYYAKDQEQASPTVHVTAHEGGHWDLEAIPGKELAVPNIGTIKVLRTFKRFRLDADNNAIDSSSGNENPAVEIELTKPDGTTVKKFVYLYFPDFTKDVEGLKLTCEFPYEGPGMVKDYFSDLVVVEDGKDVLKKTIEVNDPLHYGGYHFYQSSYDDKAGRYTVLSVTSDSGLYAVYAGFFFLCLGVAMQFWGKMMFRELANNNNNTEQA
jgi:cytochrome c biogenesis protein ResB